MQNYDAGHPQQQANIKNERVRGIQSGEVSVCLNGAKPCEPQGTLYGAKPLLQKLLHPQDDDASAVQRPVQPSEVKLIFSRNMRRQIRECRRLAEKRWNAIQETVEVYDSERLSTMVGHFSSGVNSAVKALERYLQQFQQLEQAYKQHVTRNILHLYALLEAESQYITAWSKREAAKCRDQRALTKLLHQFNSFALQLESETSRQVQMWRLPPTDAQRIRCVKAATENIKKRFLTPSSASLEVLEVYKIENRVLLHSFQRFTTSLAQTTSDIKIKGLFCSVPAESVERCIVYGMHDVLNGEGGEPRFLDLLGEEVKIFNRSVLLQSREDAPGTNMEFRARSKVVNGTPLHFPRRFSRYSTLEEMRTSMSVSTKLLEDESPSVQYVALCRVAMSKTLRVTDNSSAIFPEDPSVAALLLPNEEEYLIRYPDAVVPEFIIQFRVVTPPAPLPGEFSNDNILPVSLTASVQNLGSDTLRDFMYSAAIDSTTSGISAFPLSLPASDWQCNFTANAPVSSSPTSPASVVSAKKFEQISPETVLANCARHKTQLREDLQRLESLFWTRTREVWVEEAVRSGVRLRDNLHTSHEQAETRSQQLGNELDMLNQVTVARPPKARAQPKKLVSTAVNN